MAGPGTLIGGVVAVGVGEAASTALDPVLEPQRQAAWAKSAARIFDLGTLAELAAQGLLSEADAISEGRKNGYSKDRVQRAIQLALKAAPVAELLELWRRGEFGDPTEPASAVLVDHGLAKAGIEPQYWEHIKHLFYGRLDPADVARAIQRGVMNAPFDLPYSIPAKVGKIAAFPVSPLSAEEQARAHGMTVEQLRVLTALVGLPLALDQAARATFRKIIDLDDYDRAVLEGNTRGEWGRAALEVARDIPTSHTFVEGRLRGWLTDAEMYAGTARHGMSPEDTHLDFLVSGRPLSWHQVFVGIRRGGIYDGPTIDIAPAFLKALKESNIRPEWYHIAWHLRFSYPSGFMIRGAVTSGDLTPQQGNDILFELGWDQKWIDVFVKAWSGGSGSSGTQQTKAEIMDEYAGGYISPDELRSILTDLGYTGAALEREIHLGDARRLKTLRERVVKAIADAYRAHVIDETAATSELAEVNVLGDAATMLIALWDKERRFTVRELSDAQVAKAGSHKIIDPAAALAELQSRGYSAEDAQHLIDLAP